MHLTATNDCIHHNASLEIAKENDRQNDERIHKDSERRSPNGETILTIEGQIKIDPQNQCDVDANPTPQALSCGSPFRPHANQLLHVGKFQQRDSEQRRLVYELRISKDAHITIRMAPIIISAQINKRCFILLIQEEQLTVRIG